MAGSPPSLLGGDVNLLNNKLQLQLVSYQRNKRRNWHNENHRIFLTSVQVFF